MPEPHCTRVEFKEYIDHVKSSIIRNTDGTCSIRPELNEWGRDMLEEITETRGSRAMREIIPRLTHGDVIDITAEHKALTPPLGPEKVVKLKPPIPQFLKALVDVANPDEPFTAGDVAVSKFTYDIRSAKHHLNNGTAACVIPNETMDSKGNWEYRFTPVEEDTDMLDLCLPCKARVGWSCPLLNDIMNYRLATKGRARHTILSFQRTQVKPLLPEQQVIMNGSDTTKDIVRVPARKKEYQEEPLQNATEKKEPIISANPTTSAKALTQEHLADIKVDEIIVRRIPRIRVLLQKILIGIGVGKPFTVVNTIQGSLTPADENLILRESVSRGKNIVYILGGFFFGSGAKKNCISEIGNVIVGRRPKGPGQWQNKTAKGLQILPKSEFSCNGCQWNPDCLIKNAFENNTIT
ncbi:hypothetical protein KBD45_02345 [Candidatus Dojkabacteria bacterium]|nr:hypothetical protein [Candidatus Dojkabacteria bacterium]